MALLAIVLALPCLITPEQQVLRFFASLAAMLVFVRVWQTYRGLHPSESRRRLGCYLAFFMSLPDLEVSATAQQRRDARRRARHWFGRCLVKVAALFGLFVISSACPAMHDYSVFQVYWYLFAAYVATSGYADAHGALVMLLSGHRARPVFDSPVLATSPRDFWGRRWNLMFRNSAHALIFEPLGGASRPLLSVTAVFVWSALAHEYLVWVPLGHTLGYMSGFFAIHCLGTLANGWYPNLVRRRWLSVALHWLWLGATAPLFFTPLKLLLPAHTWRLW